MRKSLAISCALLLLTTLAAFAARDAGAAGQAKGLEGTTLRVGTWGGSWRDARHELIGKKLEQMGVKVEYVLGHPRDNFAKLVAARARGARPPVDVMEISPELTLTLEKQGLLEPLDYHALPNATDVHPSYRTPSAVATQVIQIGIAYNERKFSELGLPRPTSFADLFRPELAGRVAMTDINTIEAPYILVALASLAGGTEQNIDPGFRKLTELKPAYLYKASTDLSTKFTLGEIWAAPWHAGWVLRVKRTGFPIAHADPRVGDKKGILAEELMGVIRGTEAREAAQFWINAALDPENQVAFARKVGVIPTNRKALEHMGGDPDLKDFMWQPSSHEQAFRMDWKVVEPQMPAWIDKWNRSVTR